MVYTNELIIELHFHDVHWRVFKKRLSGIFNSLFTKSSFPSTDKQRTEINYPRAILRKSTGDLPKSALGYSYHLFLHRQKEWTNFNTLNPNEDRNYAIPSTTQPEAAQQEEKKTYNHAKNDEGNLQPTQFIFLILIFNVHLVHSFNIPFCVYSVQ